MGSARPLPFSNRPQRPAGSAIAGVANFCGVEHCRFWFLHRTQLELKTNITDQTNTSIIQYQVVMATRCSPLQNIQHQPETIL